MPESLLSSLYDYSCWLKTMTGNVQHFSNRPARSSEKEALNQVYARLIAENSTDAIAILDSDAKTEWVNKTYIDVTGYSFEEWMGKIPADLLVGPLTNRGTLRDLMRAGKEKRSMRCEVQQYPKSGDPYWAEITLTPILSDEGAVSRYLVVARDVTDRRNLERDRELARQREALRQQERRTLSKTTEWLYAARSLEDLYNVVERCAPKLMPSSSGALFIYANSRDVLDLAVSWGDAQSPSYIEPNECWALRRGRAYHFGCDEIEFPCGHFHADVSSSFCLPLLAHGETIGMLWCHSDEGEMSDARNHARFWDVALMLAEQVSLTIANVRLRQELQDKSVKDSLTGLWNRRYFLDCLRSEKARADSNALGFGLISIDIDHFKRFNDHHGHDAGDLVLRRVSDEIVSSTGVAGIVCRVGGEELSVICPDLDEDAAMKLANKILHAIKTVEILYQGEVLPCVTVSAGVAVYPSDHSSLNQLMRNADNALYQAKRAGRDRAILFHPRQSDEWVVG